MANQEYVDLAVAWINEDKNGEKYMTVVLKDDFEEGDKIYLRRNKFKKPGEKSPDYRYSRGNGTKSSTQYKHFEKKEVTEEDISDDVPF